MVEESVMMILLWVLLGLVIFLVGSVCMGGAIVLVLFLASLVMDGVCVVLQWLAEL
jgi:hypothetical protein